MNLKNFMAGIALLATHYEKQDDYHIGAEHDQFFMYITDTPLSDDEVNTMKELGWFQPDQNDGTYDSDNSWSAFT